MHSIQNVLETHPTQQKIYLKNHPHDVLLPSCVPFSFLFLSRRRLPLALGVRRPPPRRRLR
jgi:hypothetical protein